MVGRLPHAAAGWYYGLRVSGYVAAEPHRPLPRRLQGAILLEWVAGGAARGSARPCTARAAGVVCVVLEALDRSAGSRLRGHEESAVCAGCNGCSLPLSVERGCAGVRALDPESPACMRTSWISASAAFGFTLRMFRASASIIPPLTIVCFVAALTLPPSAHSKQRRA